MNDRTFRRECIRSDLIDLLLRIRDVLGGLLLLLLPVAILVLNTLDALGVHNPVLLQLQWVVVGIGLSIVAFILLRRFLHRRRERREAKEVVRRLRENPPPN